VVEEFEKMNSLSIKEEQNSETASPIKSPLKKGK